MKQLYYTSCEEGRSVDGRSGFQTRAMSPGVDGESRRLAEGLVGYELPAGLVESPTDSTVEVAPVRLALVDNPSTGRVLYHSVYCGKDPGTLRHGNFFTHMLLDVPREVDASCAIRSWKSSFWRRTDGPGGTSLPEVDDLVPGSDLDDVRLRNFLVQPAQRETFQFVLQAVLERSAEERVFLAAPSDDVALLVYGVTRALPKSVIREFTFSTYESAPLSSYAQLVGTCWTKEAMPSMDLPSMCYSGGGAAFNSYTRQHSPMDRANRFVEFAVEAIAQDDRQQLDEFLETCNRLQWSDGTALELVFTLIELPSEASIEDVKKGLHHPELAPLICKHDEVLERLLASLPTDEFLRQTELMEALPAQVLDRLWQAAYKAAESAVIDGNLVQVRVSFEEVLPSIRPKRKCEAWAAIFTNIDAPQALTAEVRGYLVPRMIEHGGAQVTGSPDRLKSWLDVPLDKLRDVLVLPISASDRVAACVQALITSGQVDREFIGLLSERAYRALAIDVVTELADNGHLELAGEVFAELLTKRSMGNVLWPSLLDRSETPAKVADQLTSAAIASRSVDALWLARNHGSSILKRLRKSESLSRIATELINLQTEKTCAEPSVQEFLAGIAGNADVSDATRGQAHAWAVVGAFLSQPRLDDSSLSDLADALSTDLRCDVKREVRQAVCQTLIRCGSKPDIAGFLDSVLTRLPQGLGTTTPELYVTLRDECGRSSKMWRQPPLLHAFLAIPMGVSTRVPLDKAFESETTKLVQQMLKRSSAKTFSAVDALASRWPDSVRKRWIELSKKRPAGGWRPLVNRILNYTIVVLAIGIAVVVILLGYDLWRAFTGPEDGHKPKTRAPASRHTSPEIRQTPPGGSTKELQKAPRQLDD